jgi:hypothetical protein
MILPVRCSLSPYTCYHGKWCKYYSAAQETEDPVSSSHTAVIADILCNQGAVRQQQEYRCEWARIVSSVLYLECGDMLHIMYRELEDDDISAPHTILRIVLIAVVRYRW